MCNKQQLLPKNIISAPRPPPCLFSSLTRRCAWQSLWRETSPSRLPLSLLVSSNCARLLSAGRMLQRVFTLLLVSSCVVPPPAHAFGPPSTRSTAVVREYSSRSAPPTARRRRDASLNASMKQRLHFKTGELRDKEPPKLILISGGPGTGKSTFGMSLALEQGILKCISTDTVRAVMRSYVPESISPPLHRSSYGEFPLVSVECSPPLLDSFVPSDAKSTKIPHRPNLFAAICTHRIVAPLARSRSSQPPRRTMERTIPSSRG